MVNRRRVVAKFPQIYIYSANARELEIRSPADERHCMLLGSIKRCRDVCQAERLTTR